MEPTHLTLDEVKLLSGIKVMLARQLGDMSTLGLDALIAAHTSPVQCDARCRIVGGEPWCDKLMGHPDHHVYTNGAGGFEVRWNNAKG